MNELTRAVAAVQLKKTYPNLVEDEGNALVSAARNLRIELKQAFPSIKFSVRTERFSMGDAMRVSWTDGPTTKEVEAISDKYKAGSFDGYDDLYTYDHSVFKVIFGDAKYVTCSRAYSDDLVAMAIAQVTETYGGEAITVEAWRRGEAWRWRNANGPNAIDMGRELNICLSGMSRIPQS